jgi:polyisoprenyl-teichoic acid--peptidoglycan teichoic acid transferase
MRTTLKRGVGHGIEADGNGYVARPPVLTSHVVHYRQPRPNHPVLRLLGKAFLWLLALAGMVAGGIAGAAYLYYDDTVEDIVAKTPAVKIAAKRLSVPLPNQAATALVIGYDKRLGVERTEEARSDTIMLLRADPSDSGESISMLSFPRDLWVEVRCPGRPYFMGAINQAYSTCKEQGVVETVKGLTGLQINYLVTVNFRGFKLMVEKLGGVWIDVDRRYFNDNSGYEADYATIDLKPGYQKLKGQDALDFVRYRHADSDIHRTARQQAFVRSVKERLSASFKPSKTIRLAKVIRAVTKNVEVAQGGGKNVSGGTVFGWALFAYGLPSGRVFQTKIEGLTGTGIEGDPLTTDPSNIEAAVDEFLHPDVQVAEKAAAVALGQRPKSKTGPPAKYVSVVVLNGNGVEGSAAEASYALSQRGYKTVSPPNDAPANCSCRLFRTQVYWDPARPVSRIAARTVANLFGQAGVQKIPRGEVRQLRGDALLAVVVGQTFHGSLARVPKDKTPERKPPQVIKDPTAARPYLKDARKRVDFPLYVPTVLERNSSISDATPIRTYQITEDERAVRLVFTTTAAGYEEYWGVQQTDWEDAPALQEPSTRRRIKGREYDLYFNGAKLHMIALRGEEARYWVVNTLLDSISNETMIAIAKGLKPLKR